MDYEKKIHEQSLTLARQLIEKDPSLRDWVVGKFPELRESEDERIRKGLVSHLLELKEIKDARGLPIKFPGHYDAWISYLEKHKEPKPMLKFKVGDKIHLIDGTSPNYEDDCITISEIGTINYIGEFKEGYVPIKDQNKWKLAKEQKPIKVLYIPKFREGDMVVSTLNRHLTYRILNVGSINELGNPEYKVEIFTDDKPGILGKEHNIQSIEIEKMDEWGELVEQPQSKPAWSEEDKQRLSDIYFAIDHSMYSDDKRKAMKKYINALRSQSKPVERSEDKYPKDIEADAVQFCFDKGINMTPLQAKQIATHYLMIGHNNGYVEGRKKAHIPARELGLPSSMDYKQEWSERHIADVFEKVGLAKIVREQGNDELTNAVQSAMIELSKGYKQKWSEEDERILKGIIGKIDHDQTYGVSKADMLSFLKSLRPSWKPSEEQMSALNKVVNGEVLLTTQHKSLESLYEQLKKL